MPRGGPRPGAGRPKGSKNKPKDKTVLKKKNKQKKVNKGQKNKNLMPMEYMLEIMRDESESKERRDKMAYWLAPYMYPKADKKSSKKAEREERAKKAGKGRFTASQPPILKAVK